MQKKGKDRQDFIDRVGEKHMTVEGCEFQIIEYFNARNCSIKFKNGFIKYNVSYGSITRRQIKNPYHPAVFGVGYLGVGKYRASENGKKTHCRNKWASMLERATSKKYKFKKPTYKDVTVSEEWKCFQNFAEWYYENWKDYMDSSWQLDKDILIKGNKHYSSETCCFIPTEINMLFVKSNANRGELPIGVSRDKNKFSAIMSKDGEPLILGYYDTPEEAFQVYKVTKEKYIKEVADKWRHEITSEVYKAMYAYEVEITD